MELDVNSIIKSYSELKNVWKVGAVFGITGQRVHSILKKNNIDTSKNVLTESEIEAVRKLYSDGFTCGDGKLDELCLKIKRNKQQVCRLARKLGYTSRQRTFSLNQTERVKNNSKVWHANNPHPKGMLGKKHTEEERERMGIRAKAMWKDPNNKLNSPEYRQVISDRQSRNMNLRLKNNPTSVYSRVRSKSIEIGGQKFFARSSWEANIAAYFEFLKCNGNIKDWEHEPETFWFLKIMRGVRSYKPDFRITNNDGSKYFVEVKGWMDSKSKTKLARFKKYYPELKLELIDEKRYKEIKSKSGLIPNWGMLDNVIKKAS